MRPSTSLVKSSQALTSFTDRDTTLSLKTSVSLKMASRSKSEDSKKDSRLLLNQAEMTTPTKCSKMLPNSKTFRLRKRRKLVNSTKPSLKLSKLITKRLMSSWIDIIR